MSGLVISHAGREDIVLERDDAGEWNVRLPGGLADSLNPQAVDELSALVMLPWREPMRESVPAPAPETATTVRASTASESVEIMFGASRQNIRAAAALDNPGPVFGVNQELTKVLDWPEERFRNLALAIAPSGKKPEKIVVAPGDGASKVTLERRDGGWIMTGPVVWPVDAARLDTLLRWLEKLRAGAIAAERTGDPEWFGFTADAPYVEVTYADDEAAPAVRRVEFGSETEENGGEVFARVAGRDPIFTLAQAALDEISLNLARKYPEEWANYYRQRTFDILAGEIPQRLVIESMLPEAEKLTIAATREAEGLRWSGMLERNGESEAFAVDPPSANDPFRPLTALITGLSRFRIKVFLADQAPGPDTVRWTAYPAWRISSSRFDGAANPTLTIYAADAEGNFPAGRPYADGVPGPAEMKPLAGFPERAGVAASLDDRPAVLEIFADMAHLLCVPPYRYRSRRLVDSDARQWSRVVAVQGGKSTVYVRDGAIWNEQWWLDGDPREPLMDDNNRFVLTMNVLSQLQAADLVAAAAAPTEFGLDQPLITTIVYGSRQGGEDGGEQVGDAELFRLTVGGDVAGDGRAYYARLDESGPVFTVPGELVRALGDAYR